MTVDNQVKNQMIEKSNNNNVPDDVISSKRTIIHSIFSRCSEYTLDPFWKQVFEECSRNKFPRGSGISPDGQVVYFYIRENNKNYISYRLKKKTPEKIFQDLKRMFQDQLQLRSNRDRQDLRNEIEDICQNLQETFNGNWQEIRKKNIKESLIRKYILDVKDKYSLTNKEITEFTRIIRLGFLFNWILSDDVVYENRQILDILTVHFDEQERLFEVVEPNINYKRDYKPKLFKLSSLWHKHLIHPKNKYIL